MPVQMCIWQSWGTSLIFRSCERWRRLKLKPTARARTSSTLKSVPRVEITWDRPSRRYQKCWLSSTPRSKRPKRETRLPTIFARKGRSFSCRPASRPSLRIKNNAVYESRCFQNSIIITLLPPLVTPSWRARGCSCAFRPCWSPACLLLPSGTRFPHSWGQPWVLIPPVFFRSLFALSIWVASSCCRPRGRGWEWSIYRVIQPGCECAWRNPDTARFSCSVRLFPFRWPRQNSSISWTLWSISRI